MKSFFRVLLTLVVVAFAILMVVPGGGAGSEEPKETEQSKVEQGGILKSIAESVLPESAPVPEDLPEGARYCWVKPSGFRMSESEEKYSWGSDDTLQIYYPLNTAEHLAYIFPDSRGMYRLNDSLSASELIEALNVVADERAGIESIVNSAVADAESVSRGELISVLSSFCAAPLDEAQFLDMTAEDELYPAFCAAAEMGWIESGETVAAKSSETLTRADFIILMNAALERVPASNISVETVGGSADVLPTEDIYPQFAEAAVPHEHIGDSWRSSEALEKLPEGFNLIENRLYYIDADGNCVKNGEITGRTLLNGDVTVFNFDENGMYTSGDAELDELIFQCYDERLNPEMSRLEMLRVLYDHIVDDYSYLRKHWVRKFGEHGWSVEEAKDFLSTGRGNCYGFAASFCELARGLGYDAVTFSGYIGKLFSPHGWVEIEIDGEIYVFDTETQWSSRHNTDHEVNMFMLDSYQALEWTYTKSKEDAGHGDT